jgi:hypothetical protein
MSLVKSALGCARHLLAKLSIVAAYSSSWLSFVKRALTFDGTRSWFVRIAVGSASRAS